MTQVVEAGRSLRTARLRASAFLWRRPWLRATALLTPPLAWFVVIYLLALVALFVSAFWTTNPFTTEIEHHWNVGNFKTIFEDSTYRTIALRTIGVAAAVTITDALLALPVAH